MTFQPDQHELQQVIQLLRHAHSMDREVQRTVQVQLVQLNEHQQFCCYLVFILSEMKGQIDSTSRSLAGLLLKNNIRAKWNKYPQDVKFFVRTTCLKSIGDAEPLIRATVGIIVTTIVMEENMCDWPDLLDTLATVLMQPDELMQEGALGALQKVFEDSADRYECEFLRPIMPKLLIFYEHHNAKMRALAMNSVNCILMVNNDPIDFAIDEFLTALFARHNDNDEEVQKQLCRSLTLLLDTHIEKMMPHLPNVIEYIIKKTQDHNESIALEACEFWLSIAENNEICRTMVLPHLDKLIPVLLGSMRYSETDPALKANEEDSSVPDREEDIKPRFHKSKQHGLGGIMDSDDEDEDDDDDDGGGDWNIRRCAAASLDVLASIFGKDLLDKLFPLLKDTLMNDNWLVKESGILALGAIAEGCMDGVVPHLGELIPFMLAMMFDKKPLVRSITCWTLSRYSSHIVSDENFRQNFFKDVLANLLRCSLDSNKKVQEAACSAFATLEEEAGEQLIPFLGEILEQLVKAFQCYQAKNLLILYDAIGTLANSVGEALSHPHYVQMLMPPLMEKWERLNDEDKELFPLLECISAIVSAMGQSFIPYIQPVFTRCCNLIEKCVQQNQQHLMSPETVEAPETDFIIVALDLLSGLAESLPDHMPPLVTNSKLIELMLFCSMDVTTDVRQSCFALLGDLTKACPERVLIQSSNFIFFLAQNLDPTKISVCNNAIWALGELSLKMGPAMKQFVGPITEPLIAVINTQQNMQRTLLENTAITIGRLGQFCGEELAPHISRFIRPCCYSLRNIKDNTEKESAFIGLCNMINMNPVGVLNDFIFWCDAIASWTTPTENLRALFAGILQSFKLQVGDYNWNAFIAQLPPPLRERLTAFYEI
ncbi:hypothetical protein L5515_013596 [Caenorhabditis briggsae]|uniref:Importin N-terminal domain-containing protein n=2 Tax=Caenorhabditis briggsae TaxID=6238 RepID=A0AAE9DIQ6_CAEBR|nr:hypothetical protein L3Y34_017457 [Caenorhabditis briggsae]UMM16698.1 hypothetical protein L5515_013596 [Caenorhabditis briggsae]